MRKLGIGLAIGVAVGLVAFSVVARASRLAVAETPHLVSMDESARAMQRADAAMQTHGQAMLDQGQRTGDQDLIAHGEHWLRDGQALAQGGQWMAMNPTAPGSLVSSPSELAAQGNWGQLTRTAQEMLHDPSRARSIDLEALRWNGLAMRAEGRNMAEHGALMIEEVQLMSARHGLDVRAASELSEAVMTMQVVGGHLEQNGQAMIDYADRLRRTMGYR
jgi:hypothetical protein